jgi:tetratricopeptide (TPR) repeat protein
MKLFRHYIQVTLALCVLVLLAGCASPLQKADKLAMSDPRSAIAAYEEVMAVKPGSAEAQQAHLGIAKAYYERLDDHQKGIEVYEEIVEKYPKAEVAGKANYALGWHYFNEAKDYEEARGKFAAVIKEMPGTEEAAGAALAIAKCFEELKKYDEAANLYKEFSKSHPTHKYAAQAGLSAAKSYEQAGKTDEAIAAYTEVAKDYTFSSSGREAQDALTGMGVDVSELVKLPESETEQPESEPRGMAQIGGTRRVRARNVPRPDIGSRTRPGEDGEQPASRSVSPDFGVDPMDIMPAGMGMDSQGTMYDAMLMMANMSLQMREYKNSGALYERAIKLAGNKSWDSAASAYFGLAKSYKGIGMDDKAIEMFREAIKRDRKVIDRMIVTGETQYGDEEYDEALQTYNTALGLAPHKDSDIYYDIGLVYQKLGDADKELEAFERAVALKPNATDAIQHLAEVLYYRKKDVVRAELYDKEVRGLGNTDYMIQKELGDLCYKYGGVFSKEVDRERQTNYCYSWSKIKYGNSVRLIKNKIEAQFKKIVELGDESEAKQIAPGGEKITIKLVSDAAASGNQLALETLQKSAALLAEYRTMNSRIVICQIRMKRVEDAQKKIDEIKGTDPNASESADFHLALGELALAQGQKDAGLAEIKKALEINPEHKEAAERLKQAEAQETASTEAAG